MRFKSLNSRFLRSKGISGEDVLVRLEGSILVLKGSEGGSLAIPAGRVDRLRQFRMEEVNDLSGSPAIYETRIWWDGGKKSLLLTPFEGHKSYRTIMRDFAAVVARERGMDRLFLGPGLATGIANLFLVGLPVLFLFALVLWLALLDGGWWWLAVPLTFAFFLFLGWRNIVSRWPRRAGGIEPFEAQLR